MTFKIKFEPEIYVGYLCKYLVSNAFIFMNGWLILIFSLFGFNTYKLITIIRYFLSNSQNEFLFYFWFN